MANSVKVRSEGFPKRAAKFMTALYASLNGETFTPFDTIADPIVSGEEPDHVNTVIKVLSDMQYVETQTDENGRVSLRLTPSGVVQRSIRVKGE